ncbi:hypothetical protein MNEG_15256 [Monoraphidium neglectum]|uniref:Uncharacterized protein n=1 Tax=Monoraphidium neglectum TaxID=145388 RepID=A0A0D2LSE7_9CHLO|nr:hypothetical protein MNEG_15256 [Monoraphidium neglectum]KIY92706.1 hypothetical protein MNEG_15256 [Monoraphidium neglectum]|eukprot:XP_013891726.1 hypothetical protein MNEG_15256 [Monoraphidium neglectum]
MAGGPEDPAAPATAPAPAPLAASDCYKKTAIGVRPAPPEHAGLGCTRAARRGGATAGPARRAERMRPDSRLQLPVHGLRLACLGAGRRLRPFAIRDALRRCATL